MVACSELQDFRPNTTLRKPSNYVEIYMIKTLTPRSFLYAR